MKNQIAMFAAAIMLSISVGAHADEFSRRWLAVLDGETACTGDPGYDRAQDPPDPDSARMCAEIHRLYDAMKPEAEKRARDSLRRWTMKRLQNDLREARR